MQNVCKEEAERIDGGGSCATDVFTGATGGCCTVTLAQVLGQLAALGFAI